MPSDSEATRTTLHVGAVEVPGVELRVSSEAREVCRRELSLSPLILGASEECDLIVQDPEISRTHARISMDEAGVIVEDLGSKNGIYVGGARVERAAFAHGGSCRIGSHFLEIRALPSHEKVPLSRGARFGAALGSSVAMRALFFKLERVAETDEPVVLLGESGSGKELLARGIHDQSARSSGPFVVLDCTGVHESLAESELFGHKKGAFTGAASDRVGLFEAAHGGTIFIDEIGELALDLQAKLLRVLEEGSVRRVGATESRQVDVRVVAATHRDLKKMSEAGSFRQDLYFRLAVVELRVPPLRERKADIPLLVERILAEKKPPLTMSALPPHALDMLERYPFPGNVRELRNLVARMVLFPGEELSLPEGAAAATKEGSKSQLLALPLRQARDLLVADFEKSYLQARLSEAQGNVSRAAEAAGVSRQFMHKLLKEYGISRDDD